MKDKRKHVKFLTLLLSIVMVMSTAMVFAEVDEEVNATDPVMTTQGVENAVEESSGADEEASTEADGVLDAQDFIFSIEPDKVSIEVGGDSVTLTTNAPAGADVTWKSSNTNAATVVDGVVTAGKVDAETKVTITATATVDGQDPLTATCEVTVTPAPVTFKSAPVLKKDKKYDSGYESAKDNGYYLTFTDAGAIGIDHYEILCDGKPVAGKSNIAKADGAKHEVLVPSGTHNYVVKAVGTNGETAQSSEQKISISGVITSTHAYTWYCKTKKKVKTGGVTIPKGTTLTAVGRSPKKIKKFKNPKKVQVIYKGRKVWVPYKALKGGVKARVNVKQDYSRSLKESMVNNPAMFSKGEASAIRGKTVTSGDKHLLWACLYTQRVYTFERKGGKWQLIHTDRITTGKFSHPTRSSETSGFYTVKKKKQGKVWMVQENGKRYYFTHASYITDGISFHTGTWWASGKVRGTAKANGQPGTYGCIRMYTNGAKYVFSKTAVNKTRAIVTRFD